MNVSQFFQVTCIHIAFGVTTALLSISEQNKQEDGVIVYPQVYEDREAASQKLLVIQGNLVLTLKKASVLAETVLLRNLRDGDITGEYVEGAYHERDLYQDTLFQASLLLKPQREGHYNVIGLLNFTHRIQPLINSERSFGRAHKISKIPAPSGTYGVATPEGRTPQTSTGRLEPEPRAPSSFTIETYVISDYKHTKHFGNNTSDHMEYIIVLMNSVSLRMQQLRPPGFISVIAIEGSYIANEPYVSLFNSDKLIGNETLLRLSDHLWNDISMVFADLVYLFTGRDIVDLIPGGTSSNVMGMAYPRKICTKWKGVVGEDQPGMFSGVQIAAHEIGHALGSVHDGQSNSTLCLAKDGYVMSPKAGGRNSYTFSNCTIAAISAHLRTRDAYCLLRNSNNGFVRLPNSLEELPGAVINGSEFCKKHFPKYPAVQYVKWDSDLSKCKYRCKLRLNSNGDPQYAIRFALDGTPCNRSKPEMICKNAVCM
ncbi:venom metalloproteinase antarease TserMP_A-like [Dermacentor variabilis]|uniref:venom metalloproteinase antarease TserMP_A-like n=1 Tax=Dermacentor variabilis TaxID=34621 RepID=UPI003F5AE165